MRLYSYQSLEVCGLIYTQGVYVPDWARIYFKSEHNWGDGFEHAYLWMIEQYNTRKGTNYQTPPVFWYTDLDQVKSVMGDIGTLLSAEVPDDEVLLHNFDSWNEPINHFPITMTEDPWWWDDGPREILAEKHMDLCFKNHIKDKLIQPWVHETWKHIFQIPRCKKADMTIHAITGCIKKEWLKPEFEHLGDAFRKRQSNRFLIKTS